MLPSILSHLLWRYTCPFLWAHGSTAIVPGLVSSIIVWYYPDRGKTQYAGHCVVVQLGCLDLSKDTILKTTTSSCMAPSHLENLLVKHEPQKTLRSGQHVTPVVPKTRQNTYGDWAFSAAAPQLRNRLLVDLDPLINLRWPKLPFECNNSCFIKTNHFLFKNKFLETTTTFFDNNFFLATV